MVGFALCRWCDSLTNLDKVIYPGSGAAKGDLVHYWTRVAPVVLPHLADRPLSMVRFPDSVDAEPWVGRHMSAGTPEWVRRVRVPSKRHGIREQVVGDSAASLGVDGQPVARPRQTTSSSTWTRAKA